MARSLDAKQQEELTAFVNALAEIAGYPSSAEWSRDSGYAYPNLTKLRNAKGAVDGYNLLRLIRSAAARSEVTPEQLALALARATAEDASDESLHRRLDELAAGVNKALELLAPDERASGEEPRSPAKPLRTSRRTRQGRPA